MKNTMPGTKIGSMKRSLGLKGPTKPGDMISRMNAIKSGTVAYKKSSAKKMSTSKMMACKTCASKTHSTKDHPKTAKKMTMAKPQGRGITRALGQGNKKTGGFAKIEKAHGKGAAIAALQNKLRAHRSK